MGAKYIYRMDDITPCMDWKSFWRYIHLFRKYGVKPLLGVVPDNRDPGLICGEERQDFWQIMRDLQSEGIVEFAQHGFQHLYVSWEEGILGRKYGFMQQSEFVGLSYDEQYHKIKAGMDILRRQGIHTDIWMAPSHSFDRVTLKALEALGFSTVTDGVAVYPWEMNNLIFIPQQMWEPGYHPFGIITVCLHTNHSSKKLYRKIERHLKSGAEIISFGEALQYKARFFGKVANAAYKPYFILRRRLCIMSRGARLRQSMKRLTGAFTRLFTGIYRRIICLY